MGKFKIYSIDKYVVLYLDLSHLEDKRMGIPIVIEYISFNNTSYKYQVCKFILKTRTTHFETPFTPVCVKAAPGWPKSEGGGVR